MLGTESKTETVNLSTLLGTNGWIEMPVMSLNVTNVNEENTVYFDKIYALNELPITTRNGAAIEEVSDRPHLWDIKLPINSNKNGAFQLLILGSRFIFPQRPRCPLSISGASSYS